MACRHRTIFRFSSLLLFSQRAAKLSIFGFLPAVLAGCSMSFPISPLMSAKEDATGTVPKSPIASLLEPEDWRRAKAALSTALDPQGNGSLVGWENPIRATKALLLRSAKPIP